MAGELSPCSWPTASRLLGQQTMWLARAAGAGGLRAAPAWAPGGTEAAMSVTGRTGNPRMGEAMRRLVTVCAAAIVTMAALATAAFAGTEGKHFEDTRGRSSPHEEPAPEAARAHQARPVTERGPPVGINVDAQALVAREQTATEAVSPAMLAVTSLRHLTPG
jgi:hypothetical protein